LLGTDITRLDWHETFDRKAVIDFAAYLEKEGLTEARQEYIRQVVYSGSLNALFKYFNRQIEDLADRLNKKVKPPQISSKNIPIPVECYRKMFESFVHIFRNIMDYGIETPDKRRACGKDESGHIDILFDIASDSTHQQWLRIEIKDDGAGVDIEKVRMKLHAKDLNVKWETMTDQQILDHMPVVGVSTSDTISHYSGRGIGLSAVYHEVKKLGGDFHIQSILGQGTKFLIDVPYKPDITSVA